MHTTLRSTAIALLLGLAGVANAAVMEATVDGSGNFTIQDTTAPNDGFYDFIVQPTTAPNPVIYYDLNPNPQTEFNQSPAQVGDAIAAAYGTDPALLVNVAACAFPCSGVTIGTNPDVLTITSATAFDYLAIHLGGGELFFHWASPITSMTLQALDGWPSGLSNYRTYSAVPLPGAALLFLSALGFFGLRRKLAGGQPTPA